MDWRTTIGNRMVLSCDLTVFVPSRWHILG